MILDFHKYLNSLFVFSLVPCGLELLFPALGRDNFKMSCIYVTVLLEINPNLMFNTC